MKYSILSIIFYCCSALNLSAQSAKDSLFHIGVETGWFWNNGNVQIESSNGFFSKASDIVDYRKAYLALNFSYQKPRYSLEFAVSTLSNVLLIGYNNGNTSGSTRPYIYLPLRYYRTLNLGNTVRADFGAGAGLALLASETNDFISQSQSTIIIQSGGVTTTTEITRNESIVNRQLLCLEPTLKLRFKMRKGREFNVMSRYIYSLGSARREKTEIQIDNQPPQIGTAQNTLSGFVLGLSFSWHLQRRK